MINHGVCACVTALQLVEPPRPSLTLQAGDNITFVCVGDNAAVIAWYQSNRLVTLASRDVSLKFDRDYDANRQTALLTRAGLVGSATGDYQCRHVNSGSRAPAAGPPAARVRSGRLPVPRSEPPHRQLAHHTPTGRRAGRRTVRQQQYVI